MTVRSLIGIIIGVYLAGMLLFWFSGEGTKAWNIFFYSWEKLFAAAGFALLAIESKSRIVIYSSIYAVAVCVFMFLYYLWCYSFGHSNILAVGSFIGYSIIILILLKRLEL